jgi:hypothetical protein
MAEAMAAGPLQIQQQQSARQLSSSTTTKEMGPYGGPRAGNGDEVVAADPSFCSDFEREDQGGQMCERRSKGAHAIQG